MPIDATQPYDDSNIFARILRGEIPAHKVYEDDDAIAFMDVMPQGPGHLLVVPKAPSRNLLDADPQVLAKLIAIVQRLAVAAKTAFGADGVSILQYNEAAGGQSVFHLHFHIVPRWTDREMKGHGHAPMADTATLRALADRIAAELD